MTAPAIGFRKYNPGFLPDCEIVSRFVVRQTELDSLLGLVRGNDGPFNQHALVLGPRGFGKSHLVHRVAAECRRDEALRERWLPVVFAEESYQVASLGELWAEAVDRLSIATGEARWEGIATELRKERDERRLAARALATLLELADTRKQRLLIIIENLDQLMDEGGLPSDDAWSLRKTLQNEPRVMLLATAVHRFEGIERPDQALFDLFYRVELAPLDARECSQLWLATTGEDLGVRRARSLAILAGGNPRLIVALASFARGRKLAELLVDFDELIDDWTDYFKGNIEAMPPQLRRVFLTLAELWRPSPARAVAEAARMPVNEASAALQRLTSQGRVTITRTQGKSHYYQVSERLYNIYYLMRRRGPGAARVRALLDFVRHMFGPEARRDMVHDIAREACLLGPEGWGTHAGLVGGLLHDVRAQPAELRAMMASIPENLLNAPELQKHAKRTLKKPAALIELLKKPNGYKYLDDAAIAVCMTAQDYVAVTQSGRRNKPREELVKLAIAILDHPKAATDHVAHATWRLRMDGLWAEATRGAKQLTALGDSGKPVLMRIIQDLAVKLRTDEVNDLIERALLRWPEDTQLRRSFALIYFSSFGQTQAIQNRIVNLLSGVPSIELDASDVFQLCECLVASDRQSEAQEVILRAFRERPAPHGHLWEATAFVANHIHSLPERRAFLDPLVRPSTEAAAWERLAAATVDKPEIAVAHLDRALHLEPKRTNASILRVSILCRLGRIGEAASIMDAAILVKPAGFWYWPFRMQIGIKEGFETLNELLDRYMAVSGTPPEVNRRVAELLSNSAPAEFWPRALALVAGLGDPDSHRLRARFRGALEGPAAAFDEVRPLFLDREVVSSSLDAAQSDTIRLAAAGLLRPTLDLLLSSPAADLIEPLIVALQRKLGETVDAPIEVSEVAEVIERRIDALRETGGIWRADPLTIPLADELP